jgi:hypothetical protein
MKMTGEVGRPPDAAPKPWRDRSVDIRGVGCPVCGVAAGEPCTGFKRKTQSHRPRRLVALRKEQA